MKIVVSTQQVRDSALSFGRAVVSSEVVDFDGRLLVDVKMAASRLCVSRSTIYQLIWEGELEPVRIGRSVRFTPAQLEAFVARRTRASDGG